MDQIHRVDNTKRSKKEQENKVLRIPLKQSQVIPSNKQDNKSEEIKKIKDQLSMMNEKINNYIKQKQSNSSTPTRYQN